MQDKHGEKQTRMLSEKIIRNLNGFLDVKDGLKTIL